MASEHQKLADQCQLPQDSGPQRLQVLLVLVQLCNLHQLGLLVLCTADMVSSECVGGIELLGVQPGNFLASVQTRSSTGGSEGV